MDIICVLFSVTMPGHRFVRVGFILPAGFFVRCVVGSSALSTGMSGVVLKTAVCVDVMDGFAVSSMVG